jgi:hypothetical protein
MHRQRSSAIVVRRRPQFDHKRRLILGATGWAMAADSRPPVAYMYGSVGNTRFAGAPGEGDAAGRP